MAAQVSHVEEFGPDEGLEAGTCRSETLVLLMGHGRPAPVQEYQVEVTYDGVHHIFETTSYSSCTPHRKIRIVDSKHHRDETRLKRYLSLNIDYEERITFVNEMTNLRKTGPGQQMIPGALPEEFVELFSTIASGMRISLRAIDQGNGRK
ncbi:hypothetical protein E4U57_007594 [Claviceps arundinis]|uniref:Uncharacterized protein n=1 Tax=Claviceps arundinis TaxID=1623583 RepID=A0ABQ7PM75_9HYPO|nr:hypothetical protein E4U57_007594 [Claviceps arundinis]